MDSVPLSGCRSGCLRPVMVFDGECGFCRFWIDRWRRASAVLVDFFPFQDVAEDYPEIPRDAFRRAVYLIEPGGRTTFGADAVLRCLQFSPGSARWLGKALFYLPGGLPVARLAYGFVARHRSALGWVTRLLWGEPDSACSRAGDGRRFLRWFLGLTLFVALGSILVRVAHRLRGEDRL